jgi:hypothetical protein
VLPAAGVQVLSVVPPVLSLRGKWLTNSHCAVDLAASLDCRDPASQWCIRGVNTVVTVGHPVWMPDQQDLTILSHSALARLVQTQQKDTVGILVEAIKYDSGKWLDS